MSVAMQICSRELHRNKSALYDEHCKLSYNDGLHKKDGIHRHWLCINCTHNFLPDYWHAQNKQ